MATFTALVEEISLLEAALAALRRILVGSLSNATTVSPGQATLSIPTYVVWECRCCDLDDHLVAYG